MGILDGHVTGSFPPRALRLVAEWRLLHQEELLENWNRAREHKPLITIAPLEQLWSTSLRSERFCPLAPVR
jgi:hypothetical protein